MVGNLWGKIGSEKSFNTKKNQKSSGYFAGGFF